MKYKIYIIKADLWYSKILRHQFLLNSDHEVEVFSDPNVLLKSLSGKPN
ncbi:hypothetical protein G3567_02670 [Psychroflexus sp. YR1-1]|uniref:Uncharacterized protein n=1 Tax=Psychroflexus aurantiacus TaxID=2709310 RepID=A0A6B3R0Z4_9FLAO|nr:hypothetical protein [Psychroflexus aurantiacus]NEV93050.1 hypothetical protein [Psychroflexus aurantiacus]